MSTLAEFLGNKRYVSETKLFAASATFSPSEDCYVVATVIGGGGSGAVAVADNTAYYVMAQGGCSGANIKGVRKLSSDVTYTITVGAGGAAATRTSVGATTGSTGSASSLSGSDITTMTANGGLSGLKRYVNPTATGTDTLSRRTLATATGAADDLDSLGASSGKCEYDITIATTQEIVIATGGAGTNISTNGSSTSRSGDVYLDVTERWRAASGGGGVGGRSGDVDTSLNVSDPDGPNEVFATGGGGSYFASATSDGISSEATVGGAGIEGSYNKQFLLGAGGDASIHDGEDAGNGGIGAGGGAYAETSSSTTRTYAGDGGLFGGGGGYVSDANDTDVNAGSGGFGGGGGGGIAVQGYNTYTITSGAGGSGLILLELYYFL